MSLNYVALTITEQDAGQDAGTGSVLVAPTGAVVAAGVTVVSTTPVSRSLSSGTVTVNLVATDNTGTTPVAGEWAYEITLPGGTAQTYLVDFANGASQRLDNLTPAVAKTVYGASSGGALTNPMTTAGDMIVGGSSGAPARLAVNATGTRKFARSVSGATALDTLVAADIPDLSATYDLAGAASAALTAAEAFATSAVSTETTRAEAAEGTLTTSVSGKVSRSGDTMTGGLAPAVVTLTDGSSVALNAASGNDFRWALGAGSHTLAAPTNPVNGQSITIAIKYSGSFTPLFNAAYDFGAAGQPSWTATSGKTDYAGFRYDSALASGAGAWAYMGSVLGLTS